MSATPDRSKRARAAVTRVSSSRGNAKEASMQLQIRPDGDFFVERKRLRHVADAHSRSDVLGVDRLSQQLGSSFARRQQSRKHLHRRRFAATVGAEESENLTPLNTKAHVINRRKVYRSALSDFRP